MGSKDITSEGDIPSGKFFTTSEFAELCGVCRFTVRNWVQSGKIKSVTTMGGHRRIPRSEVLEFFRMRGGKSMKIVDYAVLHCWQYAEKAQCLKECPSCVVYVEKIDYCFLAVQRFGKDKVCCPGNCLECSYFNDIFDQMKRLRNPDIDKGVGLD
ncbi:MAG: helix-turn-helix domain-containing protein [Candidatus Omnitrophica bacterium]|nr:helix-turn-helix domain-containing protein [Candidatus Omnitrophota bacterium]